MRIAQRRLVLSTAAVVLYAFSIVWGGLRAPHVVANETDRFDPSTLPPPVSAVEYDYVAYLEGKETVRGVLILSYEPSFKERRYADVTGAWQLELTEDFGEIGPQIGTGSCRGFVYRDGTVRINLNPNMGDENVFLQGTFDGTGFRFSGEWDYSTWVGKLVAGEFVASAM